VSTPQSPEPPSPQIPDPAQTGWLTPRPDQPGWQQQPGWQHQPGWQRPPSPPVDPKVEAARLKERVRLFLILLLGLVITAQLPLPFRLAGMVLALAGGWTGIRLIIMMARHRGPSLGIRGWILALGGLGLVGVLLLTLIAEAVFYPVVSDQERCIAGANTQTAQHACTKATKDHLDRLRRRIGEDPASP
jgi:hypothetical protein